MFNNLLLKYQQPSMWSKCRTAYFTLIRLQWDRPSDPVRHLGHLFAPRMNKFWLQVVCGTASYTRCKLCWPMRYKLLLPNGDKKPSSLSASILNQFEVQFSINGNGRLGCDDCIMCTDVSEGSATLWWWSLLCSIPVDGYRYSHR
jgi:hypothetical protein